MTETERDRDRDRETERDRESKINGEYIRRNEAGLYLMIIIMHNSYTAQIVLQNKNSVYYHSSYTAEIVLQNKNSSVLP